MKILYIAPFLLVFIAAALYLGSIKSDQSQVPLSSPRKPLLIRGSIPYWDQKKATESFVKNISKINQVALFWYYIDPQGKVIKYQYAHEDSSILTLAHKTHTKVFFTLTNLGERPGDNWDSRRVEGVIKDKNSRSKHIENILSIFSRLPFDGVTIDYEQVSPAQRENFSAFIKQLAASLHQKSKLLSVAVHAIYDSKTEKRYYFQDIKSLSKSADYLSIMAYGQHENGSDPGPVASYEWDSSIIAYLKTKNLPMPKILLGIPMYGYDWTLGSKNPARDLTYQNTQNLLVKFHSTIRWDEQARSPYFSYTYKGHLHQVWFENSKSVDQKLQLAKDAGLGGASFWRLGEEDPDIWTTINQLK